MASAPQTSPQWQERLKDELSRNKKQTCLLGLLLAVGLFVGIKALAKKPKDAAAAAAPAAAAGQVSSGFSSGQPQASPGGQRDSGERDAYISQITHDIERDLFHLPSALYPLVKLPTPEVVAEPVNLEQAPVEDIEAIVRERAEGLSLQSVIDSDTPIAVINGRVLAVGDSIDGFTVANVAAGQCVLSQAGVQISLKMPAD